MDTMSEVPPKKGPEPVKEPSGGRTWDEARERIKRDLEKEYWRLRSEGQKRVLLKREKELMKEIRKNRAKETFVRLFSVYGGSVTS